MPIVKYVLRMHLQWVGWKVYEASQRLVSLWLIYRVYMV